MYEGCLDFSFEIELKEGHTYTLYEKQIQKKKYFFWVEDTIDGSIVFGQPTPGHLVPIIKNGDVNYEPASYTKDSNFVGVKIWDAKRRLLSFFASNLENINLKADLLCSAVKRGFVLSAHVLSLGFFIGKSGFRQDPVQAYAWQGIAGLLTHLGGEGVRPVPDSYVFGSTTKEEFHADWQALIARKNKMSSAQIAEAEKLTELWNTDPNFCEKFARGMGN
jgi:hypothetical protein